MASSPEMTDDYAAATIFSTLLQHSGGSRFFALFDELMYE
jgi:hypothetical protein